ncbi:MAG TPA: hypothetical protein HPQ04_12465 [Rhodospirillaceae bacterium]|nr:hypothetical protein [Rhodospirillaceae bacterium]
MKTITAALSGLLFGIGLIIAGMTDPVRIKAFLDVAGEWNPALALVMASAIAVAAPAFALARRRPRALLGDAIQLPDRRRIDGRLILGAAVFGLGWGLGGLCPGPSLVLLSNGGLSPFIFVVAMAAGMGIVELTKRSSA